MTSPLQSSGTIKLSEIVTEYGGGSNQRAYLRAGGYVANHQRNENIPTSGTLTTRNFLGTEKAFSSDTYVSGSSSGYSSGYSGIAFYQDHIGLPTNSMAISYYTGTFSRQNANPPITVYNGGSGGSYYRVGKSKSSLYKCAFAELSDYYGYYYDGEGNFLYSDVRAYFRVYQSVPWSSYYASINPSSPPTYSWGNDGSPTDSSNFEQYNTGTWWTSITVTNTTYNTSTTLNRSDCGLSGGSGASGTNNGSFSLWYWPIDSYSWGFGGAGDNYKFKITL